MAGGCKGMAGKDACPTWATRGNLVMTNTKSTHWGIRYGAVLAGIFSLALQAAGAASSQPPNIVLMTADNLGYSDLGCFGNKENQTPEIDRLASQGVRLTSFYTAGATCTVSRATLLSGRYPQRIGLNHQLSVDENRAGIGLPHGEKLIPAYLKPLGYRTACFGKWNIGFAPGSPSLSGGCKLSSRAGSGSLSERPSIGIWPEDASCAGGLSRRCINRTRNVATNGDTARKNARATSSAAQGRSNGG